MNSEFFNCCQYLNEVQAPPTKPVTTSSSLYISQSTLCAEAGDGLFASQFISKGTVLCKYEGSVLCTRDALRLSDKSYLMRVGSQCYVDAKNHLNVLARYINDCRNANCYNVMFLKSPSEQCAWVITIRDIHPSEEIFVDYGRWYWAGKKPKKLIRLPPP